jgi:hypothetical protein
MQASFILSRTIVISLCCNPNLGLVTKDRAYEGAGQVWSPGVSFHAHGSARKCEGMNPTLPSELPLWELKSRWIFEFQKVIQRVKTHLIKEFFISLESSWDVDVLNGFAWPIWILKTQVMAPKKGQGSNCHFDSWPLKIESPRFPCVQVVCKIPLESSRWGLQLCFRCHFNQRFAHKIMGLQNRRSPNCGNFGTPTWESRDKMTFGWWSHG